jgi:glycerophosphoryl diester phosphodiesterase
VRFILFVLFVFTAVIGFCQSSARKALVIAHRGDHTEAPENTLKAFRDAIAYHLDYVEVDLRTTNDNQLVVMHDATLDRMTTRKGAVKESSAYEIEKCFVLDKSKPQFGQHKVPLFSEVLDLCKGRIKIYLDFKDADVKATWELIQSKGMEKSFVVYINHINQYISWRQLAPQVPLMVSLPDSVTNVKALNSFLDIVDAEILDGDITNYSMEMVKLAIERNRDVWLDFQQPDEGPNHWIKGTTLGISGFQSDKPRELKVWLSRQTVKKF